MKYQCKNTEFFTFSTEEREQTHKLTVGDFHLGCSLEIGDLAWYPAKVNVDFIPDNNRRWYVNISWTPLTGEAMYILLTGLLVFRVLLVQRIWFNIKSFHV